MIKRSILLLTLIGYVGTTKPALSDWVPNFCKNGYQTVAKINTPQPVANFFNKVACYTNSMLTVVKKHPLLCGLTGLSVAATAYCYSTYRSLKNENSLLQQQHEETCQTLRRQQETLTTLRREQQEQEVGMQRLTNDNECLRKVLQQNTALLKIATQK